MNSIRFLPPYSDESIVAWLDGEMNESEAQRFAAELEQNEQLARRTDALRHHQADFEEAFAPLLEKAPKARLEQHLAGLLARQPGVTHQQTGISRRSLIAASFSFLVIGSGLGYFGRSVTKPRSESEKIRELEAQYMSLYSAETLLDVDNSLPVLQQGLARVAQDIGLRTNEQQLAIQDAELKMVRILRYDSTSIAQIAWMHADYGPMALCISPEKHPDSTLLNLEQRHDMHLVWWHHRGYQFVLIGRNPVSQLKQNAQTLQTALA